MTAADDDAADREMGPSPVSPCLGICLMDPRTRMCRGCLRTVEEIAAWYNANNADKRAILARLEVRRREAEPSR
jgi:predicted Fe-S protein YdhL (DUF1289 family)